MTSNPDESNQTRCLCFDERFDGTTGASHFVKFCKARDSVDLVQVEAINLQVLELPVQLAGCTVFGALHGLTSEEEAFAFTSEPGA